MGRKRNQPSVGLAGVLAFVLVCALVIGFAYIVYTRKTTPLSVPASQVATDSTGELVSDNGTIFGGQPRAKNGDLPFTVLHNIAYTVGYSEERKDPLWSAYHVIRMDHPFNLKRPTGEFLTDNRTVSKVTHHDFTGSGYDRGHMTPNSAIARCFGEEAQHETFFLSNICPQSPALNEKVWEKLEKKELDYAETYGEVWVVDGPVFGDSDKRLRSGIAVPISFYKIVMEDAGGKVRVFGVIMPQMVKGTEVPQQYLTSVGEIEKETGLEFLWKLPEREQAELKATVNPMW